MKLNLKKRKLSLKARKLNHKIVEAKAFEAMTQRLGCAKVAAITLSEAPESELTK